MRNKSTSGPFARQLAKVPFERSDDELVVVRGKVLFFFTCIRLNPVDQAAMSSREALNMKLPPIQSTAGAVPVRNEKGETQLACSLAGG